MPQIKACLFDMDGLLIDSERVYTETTELFLAMHNKEPVFPAHVKSQMMGRPGREAAEIFLQWSGLSSTVSVETYISQQHALQVSRFPHVALMPGADALVRQLRASHVPISLATSSTRANFMLKSSKLGDFFGLFEDHIICGDDPCVIGRGKPQPDIFINSLRKINAERKEHEQIHPHECLVFEDGVPGVEAGRKAGNHVIWVPDPAILTIHEKEVEQILGENGKLINTLEVFPWEYYGLMSADHE